MWWTRPWAFLRCCHVTCQFHGQLFASLLELFANRKHISWIAITTYPLFRKDLWRIFRNEKKYYCVKMIRRFGFNCDLLEQDMLLQMLVRFQKGCRFLISVFCCHCPCTASCEEIEQHFSYVVYTYMYGFCFFSDKTQKKPELATDSSSKLSSLRLWLICISVLFCDVWLLWLCSLVASSLLSTCVFQIRFCVGK